MNTVPNPNLNRKNIHIDINVTIEISHKAATVWQKGTKDKA
jgi:hypothetical protein